MPRAAKAPPPRSRTIPARLHAAALERLGETNPDTLRPYTCTEVARWLGEARGCPVSRQAVQRLRAAVERQTAEQRNAAIREEFVDLIAPTRAKLSRALRKLDELTDKSKSARDVAAGVNAVARALSTLSDLSGVSAPQAVDLTTNGRAITLRWADEPADDHPPAAPPGAAGGGA